MKNKNLNADELQLISDLLYSLKTSLKYEIREREEKPDNRKSSGTQAYEIEQLIKKRNTAINILYKLGYLDASDVERMRGA